jgi:hypothetical protein
VQKRHPASESVASVQDWRDANAPYSRNSLLQKVQDAVSINKLYWLGTVSGRFTLGLPRKHTRSYEQATIGAAGHCSPEVANLRRSDRPSMTFRLENDLEGH